ncbi:MAG: flagellar hook-basal body complex protein FliE [Symbiobacteriia bacterium]
MDPLKLMPVGSRIHTLASLGGGLKPDLAGQAAPAGGTSFADALQGALQQVQQLQNASDQEATKLATGQSQDLHAAMIATEKATLALDLTVEVRNKVLDAYQEIMRLPV